jgi:hypothetical protein
MVELRKKFKLKKICVHVIDIGDYFPELKQLTIPTVVRFCENIGADLKIITERRFPDWPVLTEKLQVYDNGMEYDYNILLDLDILIHPDCYNPFIKNIPETYCSFKDNYHADTQLRSDFYFKRDGRNVGISGCAIFTTRHTHNLWKFPQDLTREEILDNILQERKIVDEYVVSRNLSKYGFRYIEPYPISQYDLMFHLGNYKQNEYDILDNVKLWYKTFWR